MAELLAVPLEDGGTVLVEINETGGPAGGVVKAGRPGERLGRAAQSMEAALAPITAAARAALGQLRKAGPDEVTVEFGVQFRAELGAVISRSSGECNLKVTMRWGGDPGTHTRADHEAVPATSGPATPGDHGHDAAVTPPVTGPAPSGDRPG